MLITANRTERSLWGHRTDLWFPCVPYWNAPHDHTMVEQQITCWKFGPFRLTRTFTPRYIGAVSYPNPPEFRAEDSKVEAVYFGGTTRWVFDFTLEHEHERQP